MINFAFFKVTQICFWKCLLVMKLVWMKILWSCVLGNLPVNNWATLNSKIWSHWILHKPWWKKCTYHLSSFSFFQKNKIKQNETAVSRFHTHSLTPSLSLSLSLFSLTLCLHCDLYWFVSALLIPSAASLLIHLSTDLILGLLIWTFSS